MQELSCTVYTSGEMLQCTCLTAEGQRFPLPAAAPAPCSCTAAGTCTPQARLAGTEAPTRQEETRVVLRSQPFAHSATDCQDLLLGKYSIKSNSFGLTKKYLQSVQSRSFLGLRLGVPMAKSVRDFLPIVNTPFLRELKASSQPICPSLSHTR